MVPVGSDSSPFRSRAGCTVLSLLAAPLCAPVLRAHLDGPLRLPDLRERISGAAQATLRGQVVKLRRIGALERHALKQMPYAVENELTGAGRGILEVAEAVEAWLTRAPQGPIALGSEPAKEAIGALTGGWDSTILRALAARPLSLTELDGVIPGISYPSLGRRLSAMRAAGQVEGREGGAGSKPYAVTDWTRQAVGPLVNAGRCECRHMADVTDPMTRIDIETGFLLTVPLIALPLERTGACLLAVDTRAGEQIKPDPRVAGVHVEVENGAIASCVSRLEPEPRTWALATVEVWLDAILDGRLDRLRVGGEDPRLARAVVEGLSASLSSA